MNGGGGCISGGIAVACQTAGRGLTPGFSWPHVKVSLGKTLNPTVHTNYTHKFMHRCVHRCMNLCV